MLLVSLVCVLALSSSAFGASAYGSYSGRTFPSLQYGSPAPLTPPTSNYGEQIPQTPPMTGYSSFTSERRLPSFDVPAPAPVILTEADIQCKGQLADTIIPFRHGNRFFVCLGEDKGVEQSCPQNLIINLETRRCERKVALKNPCELNPCLNNGECIRTDYSFECRCQPGFGGRTCELDSRVCQTQQPCGLSFDTKCQSFHFGAALEYVCIIQDGLAYGLSAQQTHANPCQNGDGLFPLAFTNKGFIMCDNGNMFVESCPGGTIFDDLTKVCVWPGWENGRIPLFVPDTKPVESKTLISVNLRNRNFGVMESNYGSQVPSDYSYTTLPTPPPTRPTEYGYSTLPPRTPEIVISPPAKLVSYGSAPTIPRVMESNYGSSIPAPRPPMTPTYGKKEFFNPPQPAGY